MQTSSFVQSTSSKCGLTLVQYRLRQVCSKSLLFQIFMIYFNVIAVFFMLLLILSSKHTFWYTELRSQSSHTHSSNLNSSMSARCCRPKQDPTTHDTTHLRSHSKVCMQTGGQSLMKFLKNNLSAVKVVGKTIRYVTQKKHRVHKIAK